MPRITIPEGKDPLLYVWAEEATPLTVAAGRYSDAVYQKSVLGIREFEAARITMARINDCAICLNWRTARDVPARANDADNVEESFYALVLDDPASSELTERERLAAEFARLYSTDHLAMDDDFWARLRAAYSDAEVIDLALCVASWLALGRFNRVFDIDGACRVH
jgi:alkylhydroperoxidase family enzyme